MSNFSSRLDPSLSLNERNGVVVTLATPTGYAIFIESYNEDPERVAIHAIKIKNGKQLGGQDSWQKWSTASVPDDRVWRFERVNYSDAEAAVSDFKRLWDSKTKSIVSNEAQNALETFSAKFSRDAGSIPVEDIEPTISAAYMAAFGRTHDYDELPPKSAASSKSAASRCCVM